MTDPIVHIPVMDICSSGQAYLMSAGPAMNVTIPPLHQALVTPLIQETDFMAEKSARDTLRLLISGSSQLYSVLANVDGKQSLCAAGSKGLYEGATDVNHAISNSIAAMGLVSLSEIQWCYYEEVTKGKASNMKPVVLASVDACFVFEDEKRNVDISCL
ncbi:hypothetical protein Tco_1050978 [Tanacetum coccineum]